MPISNSVVERFGKLAEEFVPTSAHYELTHRCNATCRYCYLKGNATPNELDTETVCSVIDKLFDNGILNLTITGGDPFIRDDITEILSHVFAKDFFHVTLMTNGTLLKEEHVSLILENRVKIKSIAMTIFSHLANVHDKYMGIEGGLEKTVANATRFRDAGLKVNLALNVTEANLQNFVQTKNYFIGLGFDIRYSYPPVLHPPNAEEKYFDYLTNTEFYHRFLKSLPDEDLSQLVRNVLQRERPHGSCGALVHSITVDPAGYLRPCIPFIGMRSGNILEPEPISGILQGSSEYMKVRNTPFHNMEACSACRFRSVCSFCPGAIYSEDKQMLRPYLAKCHSMIALGQVARERGII